MAAVIDPQGNKTAFHYDRQGRLTKQQIKQGHQQHTTHYRYDANGRLTDIDNGESRLAYRYDALGRLVEETVTHQMLDNAATKVSYQYDANGNRIKTGLPSGDDIHYFYYGTGHLSGIKLNHQLISEITRDKRHREITRTQGRITGEYQYNPLGQLTKQQAGLTESTAIRTLARTFTYDPSGNLQQSDTRLFTGGQFERDQTTYQYDPLGRIEHAHSQGNGKSQYHERFRFDPAHNLIEHDNQIIKNNRISHYAGVGFTYDSLGNTLATTYDKDNRVSYRYDLHDRLIGAEIATRYRKEHWVYYYDAVGRRIAKAKLNKQGEPEIHTLFVWDGSHLVQEIQKGKNAQENDRTFSYIYAHPDSYEPLAQCIGRKEENPNRIEHEINYFHCDQIGIPREMTDSQGKLIWRGRYDAWGGLHYDRHLAQQNQGHQPFRLQNQYSDEETGLHYNFLRYYEPMTGRFMTQDPIGLAGGENFYRFAPNVERYLDPLGLSTTYIDQFGDWYGASAKYSSTDFSFEILSKTLSDMKKYKLVDSDQFFHCTAFCKVSKSNVPDKNLALGYGIIKEGVDWLQNLIGRYGDNKLSQSQMLIDMKKDIAVNEYGFKCPSDQSCAQRCEKFINKEHLNTKEFLKQKGYL